MLTTFFIIFLGFFTGHTFSRLLYRTFHPIRKWKGISRQKGYHIHHSMYGVALLFSLPLFDPQILMTLFLSSLAVGIILDHTRNEGFIFITKEANDTINRLLLSEYFLLLSPHLMGELAIVATQKQLRTSRKIRSQS